MRCKKLIIIFCVSITTTIHCCENIINGRLGEVSLGATSEMLVVNNVGRLLLDKSRVFNRLFMLLERVCVNAADRSSILLAETSAINPLLISVVCTLTLSVVRSMGGLLASCPPVSWRVNELIRCLHMGHVLAVDNHWNKGRNLKI